MGPEAFLDAAYAIALASPSDQLHGRAVALAEQVEAGRTRLVTTRAVLLEIGNALAKRRIARRPSSSCPRSRRISTSRWWTSRPASARGRSTSIADAPTRNGG